MSEPKTMQSNAKHALTLPNRSRCCGDEVDETRARC